MFDIILAIFSLILASDDLQKPGPRPLPMPTPN
jgi:hypothetical protein